MEHMSGDRFPLAVLDLFNGWKRGLCCRHLIQILRWLDMSFYIPRHPLDAVLATMDLFPPDPALSGNVALAKWLGKQATFSLLRSFQTT